MAVMQCKACGRLYNYSKEGCCPGCGAYNRPPKRNRVNADGTVQHMTDTAYEKRQHAQGKVCFEEKECYEDQARRGRQRDEGNVTAAAAQTGSVGRRSPAKRIIRTIIGIMILYLIFGLLARLFANDTEPEERSGQSYTEAIEIESGEKDPAEEEHDAVIGEEVTMDDGTSFTVWDWERNDEEKELVIFMEAAFAPDSDHGFTAALTCIDASGGQETLTEASTVQNSGGDLEIRFACGEYDELYPVSLVLQEWENGDSLVLSQVIDLG